MNTQANLWDQADDALATALPCPFCGSRHLQIVDWADDDGEYPAIECCGCKASAPAGRWNRRTA